MRCGEEREPAEPGGTETERRQQERQAAAGGDAERRGDAAHGQQGGPGVADRTVAWARLLGISIILYSL